jgi:hypothetical protein
MKSLIRFVAILYPPRWRDRYGTEFDAMLQDGDPDLWDLFDVLKGALAMRLRSIRLITAAFMISSALVAGFVSLKIPGQCVCTDTPEGSGVGVLDPA